MKRHFITVLVVLAAGCMTQMAARKSEKQGPRIDVTADDDPAVKDADIWLDNEPKGRAPNAIATTTGRHLVELKKPGRVTFAQWVTVKSVEETVVVAPRLVALGNAPGVLHVIPNHWKYETTSSDGPPATRTVWEGGAGDFNGAQVVFLESVSITRDGTSRVDERDYYKKTGDGLYRLGVRGDTQSSDMHAISDTTFEAPQKVLPVPFQIGTSWSADTRHTLVTKTEINTRQLTGRATSTITGELAVSGRDRKSVV